MDLCSGQPTEETSIFSSVPLGFYILGSMFMLIGAKYIAGQCESERVSVWEWLQDGERDRCMFLYVCPAA